MLVLETLHIYVEGVCEFLVCMVTDLFFSNNFSTDDVLSLYTMQRHLSCKLVINLVIHCAAMVHLSKWAIIKL